jgi:hypothetical protein
MHKPILIPLIVFGFIVFAGDTFGQQVYKSVDEKGTINFSDNPNSSVIKAKKGAPKQDGAEVLKRDEIANRKNKTVGNGSLTDDEIKAILAKKPTWRGNASSGGAGSSGTVRRTSS